MTTDQIYTDPETIQAARDGLSRHGVAIAELPEPVRGLMDRTRQGAGEFSDELADATAGFELSWTVVLDTMATSLGNTAANVGGFGVDLVAVDLDLSD